MSSANRTGGRIETTGALTDPAPDTTFALLADCSPRSPYRTLDWRWRLATFIAAGGRPPRRAWIDESVAQAVRYQQFVGGHRRRRPPGFAVVEGAFRLHTGLGAALREEIVLRLLSGQACDAVAGCCRLAPAVIEAYRRLFFDVSDHLEKYDYIGSQVFGPSAYDRTTQMPLGLCLRVLAFNLGPIVVNHLVRYADTRNRDHSEASECRTTDVAFQR